ncbi:PaaI family thioesterase [Streptomyces sp. NBC_01465]|uniref:PaaI family thioesterase n=1 Tax=Streptomyces sp. NBC_01465 TaxID=2903878 RepID=UPI002E375506|nr:hotdog fold domain-containing protein [Streptomyces sp. NBC_01465]
MSAEIVTVPARVHGYPGVAFGGYVAGLLADRADAKTVRVDFRGAVPVDTPVRIAQNPDGGAELTSGSTALALASPRELTLDVPDAPSWAEALAGTEARLQNPDGGFTDCYGCGEGVTPGLGLRIFAGLAPGRDLVTAAWTPDPGLGADGGVLPPEAVWAALDCPGGIAALQLGSAKAGLVTAALTATVLRPVVAGEPHVPYAWVIAESGRKHTVGIALATAEGELCAVAEALWLDPRT